MVFRGVLGSALGRLENLELRKPETKFRVEICRLADYSFCIFRFSGRNEPNIDQFLKTALRSFNISRRTIFTEKICVLH